MKTWIKLLVVIAVGFVAELFLFPVKMSTGRGRHPSETALSFAKKPYIAGTSIPKQIHHTWKTSLRDASKRIKRNVRDWDSLNPGFDSKYYTDEKISDLVYDNFPDRTKLFERLNAIQRADLFRYLVLFHHGGIYADVDVQPEMSADEWVANARNAHHVITTSKTTSLSLDSQKAGNSSPQTSTSPAAEKAATSLSSPPRQEVLSPAPHRGGEPKKISLVAAEAKAAATSASVTGDEKSSASPPSSLEDGEIGCMIGTEVVLPNQEVATANKYLGPIQFTQWAIACSPKHPILLSVLDMIEEKVEELTERYPDRKKLPTLETTGPFVWTRAIERYLNTLDVSLEDIHRIQYEKRGHSVRVGDVLLLAPCKFAKNKQWPDQCVPGDLNFIQHEFMGSWKVSEYNLAKKVVLILLSVTAGIVVLLTALYRLCKHHLEDDEPKEKFLPHPLTRSSSVGHLVAASGVGGGGRSATSSLSPTSSPPSLSPRASHGHFSTHSHSPYAHHHQSHSNSTSHAYSHHHPSYHSAPPSKSIGVSYASHYSLSATGLPSALTSSVASIPSTLASTAASALSLSAGSLSSTTSRMASSRPPSRVPSYSTMPRVASCQVLPRASHSSLLPS